ncbi:uncharacterized protein TRAVEDRAFT_136599 [Trametes versicolor FP-101664 SS1]|uniref:SAP domain-containing protein n=1 Tax=Trametes versicolor (strain FP-101664) TaxID=717944 RepID=R7S9U9_TRAVS|nr:uncharacterized protein TRAVEDRAFT_136599 [Trametes versicolor FP-101664 SS1]EIW51719.1 hypothetical protein TRAVEDRAFT_136599 [Trametes versicolor FP-101664 SS1]
MLRSALVAQLRPAVSPRSTRSFVSTVLLTKAWENETVNELRKEARKRGLPAGGNKATLITRLQQHDNNQTLSSEPFSVAPKVRRASTVVPAPPTEVPGVPASADPVPVHPKFDLSVQLPILSEPIPEAPTPIPFLPDFWDSSKVKRASAPQEPEPSTRPKVITVAGASTHHGGGPSHNLYVPSSSSESEASSAAPSKAPTSILGQLAASMAEDLSLPTSFKLPKAPHVEYDLAQKTETSGGQHKSYSRTLDSDEKTGAWVLFGLFAGSWIAAGVFAPVSEWAQKVEKKAEDEKDKATGKKH